jgi:hypothetical protein
MNTSTALFQMGTSSVIAVTIRGVLTHVTYGQGDGAEHPAEGQGTRHHLEH